MKKKLYFVAGVILLIIAAVCAWVSWKSWSKEKTAGETYMELRETVRATPSPTGEEQESESTAEPQKTVEIPIDFQTLQAQNADIYAWIEIPGTAIDYPVVQRESDSSYYLSHNTDGEEDAAGAIFTEDYNSKTFQDANTVLYGHNMKNGSMFQNLHSYADRSFFDEHREVIVYMPDAVLHYKIFAAYLYDSRHLLQSFDFSDPTVMGNYLESIQSLRSMNANIDTEMELDSTDKIITLSTCYKGQNDKRYLVQAVLESEER